MASKKKDKGKSTRASGDKKPSKPKSSKSDSKPKSGGKKAARKLEPKPVKTGKGASPLELGTEFVALFNAGKLDEIESRLWGSKVVSVEGMGVSLAWHGRKAVLAKNAEWISTHTIHGSKVSGPYVGATGFAIDFEMDVENTTTGKRALMKEVGVYTVKRGKIVREEFMYHG